MLFRRLAWIALATSFLTGCAHTMADSKPSRRSSPQDFVSMDPPRYDATARKKGYQGRGIFKIVYRDGRIVSVTAVQSTGVRYLDDRTIAHIQENYRVKAGVSGEALQPVNYHLSDWLIGPSKTRMPTNFDPKQEYLATGVFQITFKNGKIVDITTARSTGLPDLDAAAISQMRTRYRVKPGASGTAKRELTYRLNLLQLQSSR